jgi:hypothetical protein
LREKYLDLGKSSVSIYGLGAKRLKYHILLIDFKLIFPEYRQYIPFCSTAIYRIKATTGTFRFALWPLSQAAISCFGTSKWQEDIPIRQAWIEFDVENVETATEELKKQGYRLLVAARKEHWGQTVTRFLSPEGLLVGVVYTPWMRQKN